MGDTAGSPGGFPPGGRARTGDVERPRRTLPAGPLAHPVPSGRAQSMSGAMMEAKLFRARFSRLFTVPKLHPVISAISS